MDTVQRVRALCQEIVEDQGGMALAISLDIANAFNSLPWMQVGEAMRYHQVPLHPQKLIRDYFWDRDLAYTKQDEVPCRREMYCGIP